MMSFESLVRGLIKIKAETIYLIHELSREAETRIIASKLRNNGFIPKVAADYRKYGKDAVSKAMGNSDFCLVVAFTEETVKKCESQGVPVIEVKP